ncbi:hypothetical protein [Sporosalibacterium faouarense]|uniref:hypothetical protein n=1 Tax=Sporosalibacterium faouarense TaxID=516123 RepID=UPI00192C7D94|nr:hypothetical protein [Sporosalibacterium faouarense]
MNEILLSGISALFGGIVTYIFSKLDQRKKDKKEKAKILEDLRRNRPEFTVVNMDNHFEYPGYKTKTRTCNLEVYVATIEDMRLVKKTSMQNMID